MTMTGDKPMTGGGGPDTQDLDPDFAQRLVAMLAASHGMIRITSGYRDNALQTKLYAQAEKDHPEDPGKWVAAPGHSNHNKGLAADLGGDMALAHQLAPQFGLYFPMSWENWHIEPISTAHPGQDPQAYTTSPFGDVNPTQQDRSTDSAFWAANMVNALTQPAADPLNVGATGNTGIPDVDFSQGATGGTTATGTAGSGGSVDPHALYLSLKAQGLDPAHAAALVAIAGRESSYNPTAHNGNAGTGDNSYGLFQINLLGGMHSQFTPDQLSTTDGSVAAAASLVKQSGLQPWGGYKGDPWSKGTNLQAAVDASGGEVTLQQLESLS